MDKAAPNLDDCMEKIIWLYNLGNINALAAEFFFPSGE